IVYSSDLGRRGSRRGRRRARRRARRAVQEPQGEKGGQQQDNPAKAGKRDAPHSNEPYVFSVP
ncbi:hypothetical protein, partial [Neoroseomonas rubea]|uniref:hypothetical protein n=1 Tax=Neoroseomonas rubea TaxID=2748666 RepID=UPI001E5CCB2C